MFTNCAVNGARARDNGLGVDLGNQAAAFAARPDSAQLFDGALVVLRVGGNDVRDAAVSGGDPGIIAAAITAIQDNIVTL